MIEIADEAAASAALSAPSDDLLPCDIVMAGGVTSGIIYPGAVARLARRYSFHAIGGTSVGAIAAAATAAAEYQRRHTDNPNGFEVVSGVPRAMAERAADGRSRLFHLFTPDTAPFDTRPLMALLAPVIGPGGLLGKLAAILGRALRNLFVLVAVLIVTVLGLWIVTVLWQIGHPVLAALGLLATLALGIVVAFAMLAGLLALRWLPALRRNGFGICTGLSSPAVGAGNFSGLTPWMHSIVQAAAGRALDEAPLTFGDLWTAGTGKAPDPAAPRAIELSMMTSDISRQRSAQLPFLEVPTPLYVDTGMLRRYFPPVIVEWMIRRAGEPEAGVVLSSGQIRLPRAQDLPIVFAARLSLSFPVLLSAVPLLAPAYEKRGSDKKVPLRTIWYSDGGLTSNFPIHLFDAPLPSRPTFCLNLIAYESELQESDAPQSAASETGPAGPAEERKKAVLDARSERRGSAQRKQDLQEMTASGDAPGSKVWDFITMADGNRVPAGAYTPLEPDQRGILDFASTLINTARFWSDNQLLTAPGVRDRVVNIGLRDDEGGLNLDMAPDLIEDLDKRGQAAGLLIGARFDPTVTVDPENGRAMRHAFPNHRWVRFRNTMAAFEDFARRFSTGLQKSEAAANTRNEPSLDQMIADPRIRYHANPGSRNYFQTTRDALNSLAMAMAAQTATDPEASFDPPKSGAAPRRLMRFFLRPLVNNDPCSERAPLPPLALTPAPPLKPE